MLSLTGRRLSPLAPARPRMAGMGWPTLSPTVSSPGNRPVPLWPGSTFDLLSLSPAAWYDASDVTTLFQTVGGSAVGSDGQNVLQIDDKSGNGRNLTQSNASYKCTYVASGVNGLGNIRFGLTSFLFGGSGALDGVTGCSIFLVAKARDTITNGNSLCGASDNLSAASTGYSGTDDWVCLRTYKTGAQTNVRFTGTTNRSTGSQVNDYHYWVDTTLAHVLDLAHDGATLIHGVDGWEQEVAAAWTPNIDGCITWGDPYVNFTATSPHDGCEYIVFPYALSASQRRQVRSYLRSKWGTPASQAPTGPYVVATGGYEGFPTLCEPTPGTKLVAWRSGSGHIGTDGTVKTALSTNGEDWTAQTVYDPTEGGRTGHGMAVIPDGRVALGVGDSNGAGSPLTNSILFSSDGGQTWATPVTITTPAGYDWIYPYGKITGHAGGELRAPAYGYHTASGMTRSILLTSSDNGATWTLKGTIAADASIDFSEADMIWADDDNGYTVIREDTGTSNLYKASTTDGGVNWSAAADMGFTGVSPSLVDLGSGTHYLFYADRPTSPAAAVACRISTNSGSTWGAKSQTVSLQGPTTQDNGNPSAVLLSSGRVAVAYYRPTSEGADPSVWYLEVTEIYLKDRMP